MKSELFNIGLVLHETLRSNICTWIKNGTNTSGCFKLAHHQLPTIFIGQEQSAVGRECTNHGRFQSRI